MQHDATPGAATPVDAAVAAPPRANVRVAYFNGQWVPESEVRVPFRDRSWLFGDGCFDVTRTFAGKPFRIEEHIERFFQSLAYLRIDIGSTPARLIQITHEAVQRNAHLLGPGDDFWVGQRVSRGVNAIGDEGWEHTGPNVIVDCQPLPFAKRAIHYRDGIRVVVPAQRRTPPSSLSPRTKTHNYLNMVMADLDVRALDPEAWAVLLDENGNLCEGMGSNIFLVQGQRLLTPQARYVLAGISRRTVLELAQGLGLETSECDIDLYDAATADEVFLTSTSLGLCPVASVNGAKPRQAAIPGPVTARLLAAYSELVGCDIAGQYLSRLPADSS